MVPIIDEDLPLAHTQINILRIIGTTFVASSTSEVFFPLKDTEFYYDSAEIGKHVGEALFASNTPSFGYDFGGDVTSDKTIFKQNKCFYL